MANDSPVHGETISWRLVSSSQGLRASFCAQEIANQRRFDVVGDHGAADRLQQDEGEPAALDLLVLRHQRHQRVGIGEPFLGKAGDILQTGRQADCGKVTLRRAPHPIRGIMPELRGKFRRQHHADGNASPWNSRSEKPVAASSACPKVWPRLSSARSPFSRSSRATIAALARQEVAMACSRAGAAGENIGVSWPPARRRRLRRRARRIWRPRHSRRGTGAATACRAPRCRRSPAPAGETRRAGSCPAAS